MPRTLYRHILAEVVKVLTIASAVMVTVMAFAIAVKPLADGLLGPADLIRFVLYSMPTLLSFVLPLAAAFAGTLIFVRLAGDNELLACSAGGLSYAQILLPTAMLGLVLSLVLLALSNLVIPEFYLRASQTVQRDVLSIMLAKLDRDRVFMPRGDLAIYADAAGELPLDAATRDLLRDAAPGYEPEKLIELRGAALTQLEYRGGPVRFDATAARATAVLYREPDSGEGYVAIRMRHPVYFDPLSGRLLTHELWDAPIQRLPSRFDDDPRFLSWMDLDRLNEQPHRYGPVRKLVNEFYAAVVTERVLDVLAQGIVTPTGVVVRGPLPGDRLRIRAPGVQRRGNTLALRGGDSSADEPPRPVRVGQLPVHSPEPDASGPDGRPAYQEPRRVYDADHADIQVTTDPIDGRPRIRLNLEDVVVSEPDRGGVSSQRPAVSFGAMSPLWSDLGLADDAAALNPASRRGIDGADVAALAQGWGVADRPAVTEAAQRVESEKWKLAYRIKAIVHERAASAVSCLLLTVIGTLLSIRLKDQTTLTVFFWSGVLALATIILINTGQNITRTRLYAAEVTLAVLWSGNVALIVIAALLYRRIARH